MCIFEKNNQKYRNQFISLKEAFQLMRSISPSDSNKSIAEQLYRTFVTTPNLDYFPTVEIREDKKIIPITHESQLILNNLLKSISFGEDNTLEDLRLSEIDEMSFEETENLTQKGFMYFVYADKLGWLRDGFYDALSKEGLELKTLQKKEDSSIDFVMKIADLKDTIEDLRNNINILKQEKQLLKQELEELKTLQNSEIKFIRATRLLKIAAEAQEKYYTDAREKSDVAKLSIILHELKENYRLTGPEAQAIERVVRTIKR